MSRVGKVPVKIPDGVEIQISEGVVTVKGPKGSLSQEISDDVKIDVNDQEKSATVTPATDNKKTRAQWGLYRVLLNNMVTGVTSGFEKYWKLRALAIKLS